jgi:acetyl-CoA carboxylase carboxyltransferase component
MFRHYEYTYTPPDQSYVPSVATHDSPDRDPTRYPYQGMGGFRTVGEVLSDEGNPSRKKPFAIREVMASVLDRDAPPLERWAGLDGGETAVVLLSRLGGQPVTMVGIESMPVARKGRRPLDGPESWMSGSLFPESSRKVARAITAASGLQPVVVVANLSGFDGSPESLRNRQLEYGAEIGRAVVNFQGPIVFCVIARYHGGAYVVFSQRLSEGLHASALEGTYASVIGGAPAAAVVFPRLVQKRSLADPRVQEERQALESSEPGDRGQAQQRYEEVLREVEAETQAAVAQEFDEVHSVERAREVGSLSAIISPSEMRSFLVEQVLAGAEAFREGAGKATGT